MPLYDFGDDEDEIELKFDDCSSCQNFGKTRLCNGCGMGEHFEEIEPEGIDSIFRD